VLGLTRIGSAANVVLEGINCLPTCCSGLWSHHEAGPLGAFGAMAFTVGRYGINHRVSWNAHRDFMSPVFSLSPSLNVLARFMASACEALRYARGARSCWRLPSEPVLPRLLLKLEKMGCTRCGDLLPTGYSFNSMNCDLPDAGIDVHHPLQHPSVDGRYRHARPHVANVQRRSGDGSGSLRWLPP
jgi:hypothetical protein